MKNSGGRVLKKIFSILTVLFLIFSTTVFSQTPASSGTLTDQRDAFVEGFITVKGEGSGPSGRGISSGQRRIMALRAAKVTALREAAEIIEGVVISGETTLKDAAIESDDIYASVQGVIKGARIVKEDYDPVSEKATVYLSIPLTGPGGLTARLLPEVAPMATTGAPSYFQPYPGASTAAHDGLIVDCRNYPFRPALINRVFAASGAVLYDPAAVTGGPIDGEGGGGALYTDGIEKARERLKDLGSSNPLIVEASGLSSPTDVTVSAEDAVQIFASSQENNFLKKRRVVFVLK